MKTEKAETDENVREAVELLARRHGIMQSADYKKRLLAELKVSQAGNGHETDALPYVSQWQRVVPKVGDEFIVHSAAKAKAGFKAKRPYKRTPAGRARQAAAMKRYWAKRRALGRANMARAAKAKAGK